MNERRRPRLRGLSTIVLPILLVAMALPTGNAPAVATVANASDAVRDWNELALAALGNPPTAQVPGAGQPPQLAATHMAMVQIAVYDAVNSITGGFAPYSQGLPPAPSDASLDAAVATAAHDVLVGLGRDPVPPLPQVVIDRLNTLYADLLATIADGPAKEDGIAAGAAAAAAILAGRDGDGRYVPFTFTQGTDAGEWRPTSGVSDPYAFMAFVRPFALDSSSQFRTDGPKRLRSDGYAGEYNEVKKVGSTTSVRTPEQQALADFYTVSPVELFNRAFRGLTEERGLSLAKEARLFAMLNVAGADALINCWNDKEHFYFWRPITAIQEGNADGNPRTRGDTGWTSYLTTPPYSDHSSGYNAVTAAYMHTARGFFGSNRADLTVQNLVTGVIREYDRFTQVVADTIEVRILQGIHFRSAEVQGAELGNNVARWVRQHHFQRVN
jgi:hypothetical protein